MLAKRKRTPAVAHRAPDKAADKRLVPKAIKRLVFFVPEALNNGEPVAIEIFHVLEDMITDVFGGCTLHANVRGAWLSKANVHYRDPLRLFEVEVEDSPVLLIALIGIVRFICDRFDQAAVFCTITDVSVLSVQRSELLTV